MHEHIPEILKHLTKETTPEYNEELSRPAYYINELLRAVPHYKHTLHYCSYDVTEDFDDFLEKGIRYIPLVQWLCTDTHVGLYAIFLQGEFLCYAFQPYRKSDYEFYWIDIKDADRVKEFLDSYKGEIFLEDEEENPNLISELTKEFQLAVEKWGIK